MKTANTLNYLKDLFFINRNENCKQLDIEFMISSLLNLERVDLYTNPLLMSDQQKEELSSMISRRNHGEPLAYILGTKGFWNINLKVNKHVLVPRPETELIIQEILDQFDEKPLIVLDAGTGSGCIALSLANERKQWSIFANDKSKKALRVAIQNKKKLKLSVNFLRSDWLAPFAHEKFDLIVSNPPYIKEDDPCLEEDGIMYEPLTSLVSEGSGLNDLKNIITSSSTCLKKGGCLFVEHAPWQTKGIRNIFRESSFMEMRVFRDLNGDERVSSAVRY